MIPKEFIRLKKLKYLKMQNNAIFKINPFILGRLNHVTKISLIGNPFVASKEYLKVFILFPYFSEH